MDFVNQFEDAAPAVMARWRQAVKHAQEHPVPGVCLLEKTLLVSGPRQFVKKSLPTRFVLFLIRCLTLGLSRPNPWKLTRPDIVASVPLRPEFAYGGECRINADALAARRLPAGQSSLHAACAANPIGAGFADAVYLKATQTRSVTAPQIEWPGAQIDAPCFWRLLRGVPEKVSAGKPDPFEPTGLGVRHKGHPNRRALAGTIDQSFIDGGYALPADFDFAFWNAAPKDQQVRHLHGDETFELVNLCSLDAPGATTDAQGNTWLNLTLLRDECFVLCRLKSGTLFEQALVLDTVVIEPEEAKLTLVWRGVIEQTSDGPLRVCEARMRSHEERDLVRQARDQRIVQVAEALVASLRGHVISEATR